MECNCNQTNIELSIVAEQITIKYLTFKRESLILFGYLSVILLRMEENWPVIFADFLALLDVFDGLHANKVFNIESNNAWIARMIEQSQSWVASSSNVDGFGSLFSVSCNHFKLERKQMVNEKAKFTLKTETLRLVTICATFSF